MGTALYPYSFSINYEFVDTEIGGAPIVFDDSNNVDRLLDNEFALCSRTFKQRRGEFKLPRNVFLHGRGGAKKLNCLYRFEANLGEQVISSKNLNEIFDKIRQRIMEMDFNFFVMTLDRLFSIQL